MPSGVKQPQPDLLKVSSVAIEIDCHPNTVWSWIRSGALPAVRLGSRLVRVRKSDLDAFIESHLASPAKNWLSVGDERGRK